MTEAELTATGRPAEALGELALKVVGVSKTFGSTRALRDFDIELRSGEIHAFLGENGSGKSTFIKVLSGFHRPDSDSPGTATILGETLTLGSSAEALAMGCRFVHQNLGLIESMPVVDNLFFTFGFPQRALTVRDSVARKLAREALARVGMSIDVSTLVGDLTPAQQAGVGIARALLDVSGGASVRVLVLDEPTATLPANEVENLHEIVRTAAGTGVGVLYVTHRLDEIFGFAHRVTVMRDGQRTFTGETADLTREQVIHALVGSEFNEVRSHVEHLEHVTTGEPALSAENLTGVTVHGVSLEVRPGEICGVAGITGSGREELLGLISGGKLRLGGEVLVGGVPLRANRTHAAIARGVAHLPADRPKESAVLSLTSTENLMLSNVRSVWRFPFLRRRAQSRIAEEWFEKMDVRPPRSFDKLLETYSGGNQQKILLAKWLRIKPKVVLLDEPTQGVDIKTKGAIYEEIVTAAAAGAAVLVSSSDIDELVALCHRVLVLRDGVIAAELTGADRNVKRLTRAILGSDTEEIA